MLDGSLAIKNAQKQALARESVAAASKQDTSGTRFSDFVDDARESEEDRAARYAQAGEQAERVKAGQMRTLKGADAGKSLVTPEPAETPRAKVPADKDKDAKALPEATEPAAPPLKRLKPPTRRVRTRTRGALKRLTRL